MIDLDLVTQKSVNRYVTTVPLLSKKEVKCS